MRPVHKAIFFALLTLPALPLGGCRTGGGARSPEALRDAYARALANDDPAAAYAFHRIVIHLLGERVLHLMQAVEALQA